MRSRARKEASAQEVRGYKKQFAEAKHIVWKSWTDNEVLTSSNGFRTDKQGNFLTAQARWVLRGFQDKHEESLQTDFLLLLDLPGFRMSCQMAASKGWDLFHIDHKTPFLQGQSYDVNRDLVTKYLKIRGRNHRPILG